MDHKFYFWSNYIQLSAEKNYFFAFGLPMPIWATLTISAVGLGLLNFLFLFLQFNHAWFVIGYAFIMSGGASNFLERLRLGYVWDYLVVQWAGLRGVWNLADFFILIGIGIWAIGFIRQNFDVNFYGH
jgi:lipoprotein signal peptidase